MPTASIPRIVHFVYGFRPQSVPFPLAHHLAIASAIAVLRPERVVLHVDELPYGTYWDLIRPHVELRRVSRHAVVDDVALEEGFEPYRYAHHADVTRLDALLADGGIYLDIDTLTLRAFPDEWFDASFVIGEETPCAGTPPSLLNAVMLAAPGAPFAQRWRRSIVESMDGSWTAHSCVLARRLALEHPDEVTVLPTAAFSSVGPVAEHLHAYLAEPMSADGSPSEAPDAYVVHLSEHLWWDERRTDFTTFSGHQLTEHHVRTADTPYARAARQFLPEHDRFR